MVSAAVWHGVRAMISHKAPPTCLTVLKQPHVGVLIPPDLRSTLRPDYFLRTIWETPSWKTERSAENRRFGFGHVLGIPKSSSN